MKSTDIITFLVVILFGALIVGAVVWEHNLEKSLPKVEDTITFERPDQFYMDQIFRMERFFQENGLGYLLGPDWEDVTYVVDADPTVQKELDQLLWHYCLQTSDLFAMVCNYMREQDDHSEKLFGVLFNIMYRQNEVLQKYASDLMKKDADINTFRFEEESLSSVINNDIYQQTRLLDILQEMRTKLHQT